jgi:hypothetical protein
METESPSRPVNFVEHRHGVLGHPKLVESRIVYVLPNAQHMWKSDGLATTCSKVLGSTADRDSGSEVYPFRTANLAMSFLSSSTHSTMLAMTTQKSHSPPDNETVPNALLRTGTWITRI